jgi:septation ring formation regulator EzrA
MSIETSQQLENTRVKLQELEQLYTKIRQGPAASEHVQELTLRSLKKRINQFKEEITRFEARASSSGLKE